MHTVIMRYPIGVSQCPATDMHRKTECVEIGAYNIADPHWCNNIPLITPNNLIYNFHGSGSAYVADFE